MPIVTAPPVRIEPGPVTISRCLPDCGPFEIGGALYVVIQGQFRPTDNTIRVYRTAVVNNPVASDWIEQDALNAPLGAPSYRVVRVGDDFQIFYINDDPLAAFLDTILFSTSTNQFGANNSSGIANVQNDFKVAWDGAGFICVYNLSSLAKLYSLPFSVGWGTQIQIYDSVSSQPQAIGLLKDASRVYLWFMDSASAALQFGTFTPGGVLGGITTIQAATVRTGQPLLVGSKLYMPVDDRRSGTLTAGAALLWTGTPLSAPVWAPALIQTSGPVVINSVTALAASPTALTFFYTSAVTKLMYRTLFDGSTFAADQIYYDATANPPAGGMDPANAALYGVGAGLSGTARVVVQLNYDDGGDDTTFYLIASEGGGSRRRNRFYSTPA